MSLSALRYIMEKHSKDFGKKEHVLNYACQRYQLSRPNKVGAVMALIRDCQPNSLKQWEEYYFNNAKTEAKDPSKANNVTKATLSELGERLFNKNPRVRHPRMARGFLPAHFARLHRLHLQRHCLPNVRRLCPGKICGQRRFGKDF